MSDPSRRRFLASLGVAALAPSLANSILARELPMSRRVHSRLARRARAHHHRRRRNRSASAIALRWSARSTVWRVGKSTSRMPATRCRRRASRCLPCIATLNAKARTAALASIADIDALVTSKGAVCSLGPVLTADRRTTALAEWSGEMVKATKSTSFSVVVASSKGACTRAAHDGRSK